MKKIAIKFNSERVKCYSLKVTKVQIKFMNKHWRKANMKLITMVYQHVKIKKLDDWLTWDTTD